MSTCIHGVPSFHADLSQRIEDEEGRGKED